MKKIFMFFAAMLTMGAVMAQTIVSTEVQKRNVLIEEFTGVGCGYCPDGHARANDICQQYDGHAWAINIHAGGYATGSGYTTDAGDSIHEEFHGEISGYPCGVVNRGAVQSRGDWASTAANIRTQDSPVNVGAVASIDPTTRTLTVNVELYYTGTQSVNSNFLNVALVQDSIIGPQSNYGTQVQGSPYNADYVTPDGQYIHMHMLRDLLVGPWGEEITTLTEGTLVQRTYTYNLPITIGAVDLNFSHLNVIAFVTEGHRKVISAQEAEMTLLPGAYFSGFSVEHADCDLTYYPYVTVSNTFDEAVTSWDIVYDGTTTTYNKTVAPGTSDTIHMPAYTITVSGAPVQNCATTKTAALSGFVKGGVATTVTAGGVASVSFADFNIYTVAGPFTARVGVDAYRSEARVALLDQSNCQPIWSETNFGSDINIDNVQYISQLPNATYYDITFNPAQGLYVFSVIDAYGDGWYITNNEVPSGVWVSDANGSQFIAESWGYSNGPEFSQIDYYLNVTSAGDGSHNVGIDEIAMSVNFNVYPNPATDRLNISCNEAVREVSVIDMAGRTVINSNATTLNVSGLAAGVYMVRVATENGMGIQKFVKE